MEFAAALPHSHQWLHGASESSVAHRQPGLDARPALRCPPQSGGHIKHVTAHEDSWMHLSIPKMVSLHFF